MNRLFLIIFIGLLISSTVCAQTSAPAIHISCYDTEDPVQIGSENTYVIFIRNEGTFDCHNLELTSIFPEGATFVKASVPFESLQEDRVSFLHPVLESGGRIDYKITVKMNNEGNTKNQAILKYHSTSESFCVEESTRVTSLPLLEKKLGTIHTSQYDTEDPVILGNSTTYVVEVRNEGTDVIKEVVVSHELSANTSFVSAYGEVEFEIQENKVFFTPSKTIEPGEKLLYKVTVKSKSAGITKFTTFISCPTEQLNVKLEESTNIVE